MARPRPTTEPAATSLPAARRRSHALGGRFQAIVAEFRGAPDRWRLVAFGIAAALTVIFALGIAHDITGGLDWFELRGEVREGGFYVPVLFNTCVLLSAGAVAMLCSRWALTNTDQYAWIGVGLLLVFMGFDELLMIHERVEFETGIDFQILYFPVVVVGGIGYLLLLARMPRWSLAQVMWLAAAALWFASQILENLEYDPNDVEVRGFVALDDIEKVFQFTGSALFLLVALLALERVLNPPDAQ